MFITLQLIFLSVLCNIATTARNGNFKTGACFLRKSSRGCRVFIGYMSRKNCCQFKGYFVRDPNEGRLFLAAFLKHHSIPNCENSCEQDFCAEKRCPVGEFCIVRENDSICSSDCVCSDEQRLSGPVCTSNGRRYRNFCQLHLDSCWSNVKYQIAPCSQTGCERLKCYEKNKKCVLSLHGRVKCVTSKITCNNSEYDPICGVDGVTYSNRCQLKQASIDRGIEIQIAYKGVCRADANCMNVECQEADMSCVTHYRNSSPVCMKCPDTMQQCDNPKYQSLELLCLSTRYETRNTCFKDYLSCQNSVFIEIIHSGNCLLNAKWPR